jgi:hypothetical protein
MTRPPWPTIPCSARWSRTSRTRSQKSPYVDCMVKYQTVEIFHYTVWCKSPHVRTQFGDIFFWMTRHVFFHQVRQEHTGARAHARTNTHNPLAVVCCWHVVAELPYKCHYQSTRWKLLSDLMLILLSVERTDDSFLRNTYLMPWSTNLQEQIWNHPIRETGIDRRVREVPKSSCGVTYPRTDNHWKDEHFSSTYNPYNSYDCLPQGMPNYWLHSLLVLLTTSWESVIF